MLLDDSTANHVTMWNMFERCLKGMLLILQRDAGGLSSLWTGLEWLRGAGIGLHYALFQGALTTVMAAAEQSAEAEPVVDEALDRCERGEERWCLPELQRVKGEIHRVGKPAHPIGAAEDHFKKALELVHRQQALYWELPAAMSPAELWRQHCEPDAATSLHFSVSTRSSEGFGTSDLRAAHALILKLKERSAH